MGPGRGDLEWRSHVTSDVWELAWEDPKGTMQANKGRPSVFVR